MVRVWVSVTMALLVGGLGIVGCGSSKETSPEDGQSLMTSYEGWSNRKLAMSRWITENCFSAGTYTGTPECAQAETMKEELAANYRNEIEALSDQVSDECRSKIEEESGTTDANRTPFLDGSNPFDGPCGEIPAEGVTTETEDEVYCKFSAMMGGLVEGTSDYITFVHFCQQNGQA